MATDIATSDAKDMAAAAQTAPILDDVGGAPTSKFERVYMPGLPPELQPEAGDVWLDQAVWPWTDLGAKLIPEHWLYMARRVIGTVALLTVQTPAGPKLVNADAAGNLGIQAVTIAGVAQVTINGVPTVQFASGQTVAISGNVNVNINAGQSVSITAGTVSVQNVGGTQIVTATGQLSVGAASSLAGGGSQATTIAVPAGVQALVLWGATANLTHVIVQGSPSGNIYYDNTLFPGTTAPFVVIPWLISVDTSVIITVAGSATVTVNVQGLQNSVPEWLQYLPIKVGLLKVASMVVPTAGYDSGGIQVPPYVKRVLATFNVTAITGAPTNVILELYTITQDGFQLWIAQKLITAPAVYGVATAFELPSPGGNPFPEMLLSKVGVIIGFTNGTNPTCTTTVVVTGQP